MTYHIPTHTHDNDTAEEAAPLLTLVPASPAPALSFGQHEGGGDGAPATKKNDGGVSIRTLIVTTCILLGTLAVVLSGGRGRRSSNNIHRTDGTSEALLLGHTQAALEVYEPYYDPSQNYCFSEQYGFGRYCWYPTAGYTYPTGTWNAVTDRGYDSCGPVCPAPPPQYEWLAGDWCYKDTDTPGNYCWLPALPANTFPCGNWKGDGRHGYDYHACGPKCTQIYQPFPKSEGVVQQSGCPAPVYDPSQDYCYTDDNTGNYCWIPIDFYPAGENWHTVTGGRGYNECGPLCTLYDPTHDYCFEDINRSTRTNPKICWYPTNTNPYGNSVEIVHTGPNSCGPQCTAPHRYDPRQDFCFRDNDHVGKYCWYTDDSFPCGDWTGVTGLGYDNCGPKCTLIQHTPGWKDNDDVNDCFEP